MPKIISNVWQRGVRSNFYLTRLQKERLGKLSERTGLSASEILRRAIDEYWEKEKKKGG